MKRLYRKYGFAWRLVSLVGLAGMVVIGWALPAMTAPVLLSLVVGWGAAVIGGMLLLRWRLAQRA